ncbi:MAG: hypothetical protein DMG10_18705 [Acidobacteria bacterium]|nr:MAG: hypothetical protein DMG10_18705 [Acidobacteriota bacterium]
MPSRGNRLSQRTLLRERLLRILAEFPGRTLGVAGDLIADQFLYGQISRVSREAPVLVLEYRDLVNLPGGAANAANNLLDLKCRVKILGVVGRDEAGRSLVRTLSRKGADMSHVLSEAAYATPVKTRILAGAHHSAPQQVVRLDRVAEHGSFRNRPLAPIREWLKSCDAIILSDYGYGAVFPTLVESLKKVADSKEIPLVVDSRFRMDEFEGVTAITPNITELEAALRTVIGNSRDLLEHAGDRVLRGQRLRYLLVTQGRFGMTLFQRGREPVHVPIFGSDEVADVTGAGDTVIAVFTLALACGGSAEDAARLANYAAGLVVMKRGTASAALDELRAAVDQDLS